MGFFSTLDPSKKLNRGMQGNVALTTPGPFQVFFNCSKYKILTSLAEQASHLQEACLRRLNQVLQFFEVQDESSVLCRFAVVISAAHVVPGSWGCFA